MGYVAVSGGESAIEESLRLLDYERVRTGAAVGTDAIESSLPDLVDQVMGEASLYAPRLAALALKQAQGSPDEAVFLLRAFRSTLERSYVSRPVEAAGMRVRRRISAAFKDVPGGQMLGATRDYSHRLLDFDLEHEDASELAGKLAEYRIRFEEGGGEKSDEPAPSCGILPRVLDYLREEGLIASVDPDDTEPIDATVTPLASPVPRSMRLQTLARGMTQAVEAFGYAAIRGFGPAHPTIGELRAGSVAIAVDGPFGSGDAADAYYLGSIPVTEVESIFFAEGVEGPTRDGGQHQVSTDGTNSVLDAAPAADRLSFEIGYGMVFGRTEAKAIAMSVLDYCLESGDKRFPTQDEEFVLYHVDGVEATGFIGHLKLPHYVTFQSKLSSMRAVVEGVQKHSDSKGAGDAKAV